MLRHAAVAVTAAAVGVGGTQYATKSQVAKINTQVAALTQETTQQRTELSDLEQYTYGYLARYVWCEAQYINAMNGNHVPDDGSCAMAGAKPPGG